MKPKPRTDAEQDEQDEKMQRLREQLKNVRPRTDAERSALCKQVQERVKNATPQEKAAVELRRAIAQSQTATKH